MASTKVLVNASTPDDKVHVGHRARMRRKLRTYGADVFDAYELLEMILYHTIPMKDTNPIAHRLLGAFGSLDGVFSAEIEELCEVSGVKEHTARFLLSIGRAGAWEALAEANAGIAYTYADMGLYLIDYFKGKKEQETLLILLDNRMHLISIEKLLDRDVSDGSLESKEFITRALAKGASVAVLAHNHPHGPLYETPKDLEATKFLRRDFDRVDVTLAEHFIVSGDGYIGSISKVDMHQPSTPELESFLKQKERYNALRC